MTRVLLVLAAAAVAVSIAQTYKCDWSVNGLGGGDMSSTAYRCGSTAGQTASGQLTGTSYWAYIGFWQADMQVGVKEAAKWPSGLVTETRLYKPAPNPFSSRVAIRYSLAVPGAASLCIYDPSGRMVRSWTVSCERSAVGPVTWDGRDGKGRILANGVYFCRLTAGGLRATEKLVMQK